MTPGQALRVCHLRALRQTPWLHPRNGINLKRRDSMGRSVTLLRVESRADDWGLGIGPSADWQTRYHVLAVGCEAS